MISTYKRKSFPTEQPTCFKLFTFYLSHALSPSPPPCDQLTPLRPHPNPCTTGLNFSAYYNPALHPALYTHARQGSTCALNARVYALARTHTAPHFTTTHGRDNIEPSNDPAAHRGTGISATTRSALSPDLCRSGCGGGERWKRAECGGNWGRREGGPTADV